MLLKCSLSDRDIFLARHAIFSTFISVCLQLIYVICLTIIIFIFIIINHIISLIQTKLCFEHVCQKFSIRVLFSFFLAFGQFQPGIACKTVAYKKGCNQKARNNKEKTFLKIFSTKSVSVILQGLCMLLNHSILLMSAADSKIQ